MIQADLFGSDFDVDVTLTARPPRKNWQWAKPMKWQECGGECYLCGEQIDRDKAFALDHVIPFGRDGKDELDNLKATHLWCNQAKSDRMPDDPALPEIIARVSALAKQRVDNRVCSQCGVNSIAHKGNTAYICEVCLEENHLSESLEWAKNNPEKVKENKRLWWIANRDRINARRREHYKRKKEDGRESP